ncbi:MAG: hypothetical protein AB7S26_39010 [Sandaracinaceae bacterium]
MYEPMPAPSAAPVACIPSAIPTAERPRWLELARRVYAKVEEVCELPDGYALRLPGDAVTLVETAEYVGRDRMCCVFLRWTLRVEPEGGPVWLCVTGSAAGKALLRESFVTTDLLPVEVARAAGIDVSRREAVDGASVDVVAERVTRAAAGES